MRARDTAGLLVTFWPDINMGFGAMPRCRFLVPMAVLLKNNFFAISAAEMILPYL